MWKVKRPYLYWKESSNRFDGPSPTIVSRIAVQRFRCAGRIVRGNFPGVTPTRKIQNQQNFDQNKIKSMSDEPASRIGIEFPFSNIFGDCGTWKFTKSVFFSLRTFSFRFYSSWKIFRGSDQKFDPKTLLSNETKRKVFFSFSAESFLPLPIGDLSCGVIVSPYFSKRFFATA